MQKLFRVSGHLGIKLTDLDVPVPAVLRRAGLPQDFFEPARILISTEQLFALWFAIGAVSADPLIGIKLGTITRTEHFHPMAIAALSTGNLAAAIKHLARYKRLTAPEEIVNELDESEFSVSFRWLLAVDAEPYALSDYCLAWTLSLARVGIGNHKLTPVRIECLQPRPNLRPFERHFGCEVVSGASRNAINFRAADALRPSLPAILNCSICLRHSLKNN